MCTHCDGLDAADYLITVLNALLGKNYPPAGNYEYANVKFKGRSMFEEMAGSFNGRTTLLHGEDGGSIPSLATKT